LGDGVVVPHILYSDISIIPPSMRMKGEEMVTKSEDGLSVHVLIVNEPPINVMMDEEREEENVRERVERVRDPLGIMKISSVDVNEIATSDVPK
jgi:hypothetical protein